MFQGVYINSAALASLDAANGALVAAGLDPVGRRVGESLPSTSLLEVLVSALRHCVPSGILRLNRRQKGESAASAPTEA